MDELSYSSALIGLANDAGPIYCDTSFLLDLFARHLQSIGHSPDLGGKQPRIAAASQFFFEAKAAGRAFVTSIFGIEEAFQVLSFRFVKEELENSGSNFKSWKEFRAGDISRFSHAFDAGRRLTHEFDVYVKGNDIDVLALGRQPAGRPLVLESHVIADARMFLSGVAVDAMDAFHYASMLRFGITIAAASDLDWLRFPTGRLVTWRSLTASRAK